MPATRELPQEAPARQSLRIFHKVLIVMLAIALVPLVTIWALGREALRDEGGALAEARLATAAQEIAHRIALLNDANLRALRLAAATPAVQSMDAAQQEPVLKAAQAAVDWTYLVMTVDTAGRNVARSDGQALRSYADRAYVRDVLAGKSGGEELVISRTTGRPALLQSLPIAGADGARVGVLAIGSELDAIYQAVAALRLGLSGRALLVDGGGRLIAHPDPAAGKPLSDFSQQPAIAAWRSGQRGSTRYEEGGRSVVAVTAVAPNGWLVVVQQDELETYAALRANDERAALVLGGTLTLVVIISVLFARGLTRPITALAGIAEAISRGKLEQDIAETARGDELGELARAIERLRVSMRIAIERLRR